MSQVTIKRAVDSSGEVIIQNPKAAQLKYRAEVVWDGDVHCTSTVRNLPLFPLVSLRHLEAVMLLEVQADLSTHSIRELLGDYICRTGFWLWA